MSVRLPSTSPVESCCARGVAEAGAAVRADDQPVRAGARGALVLGQRLDARHLGVEVDPEADEEQHDDREHRADPLGPAPAREGAAPAAAPSANRRRCATTPDARGAVRATTGAAALLPGARGRRPGRSRPAGRGSSPAPPTRVGCGAGRRGGAGCAAPAPCGRGPARGLPTAAGHREPAGSLGGRAARGRPWRLPRRLSRGRARGPAGRTTAGRRAATGGRSAGGAAGARGGSPPTGGSAGSVHRRLTSCLAVTERRGRRPALGCRPRAVVVGRGYAGHDGGRPPPDGRGPARRADGTPPGVSRPGVTRPDERRGRAPRGRAR